MSLFKSLTRVVSNTVLTPVALIKDVCTLGGVLTKQDKPYIVKKGQDLIDSILDTEKDLEDLGKKETERPNR